jgi:HK97 family phage prohead protease
VQHLTLKATTTATDQELGQFSAVVAAWSEDREHDTIDPHAFDATIKAWVESGKQLPLLHEHSTVAIGTLDPASMKPTDQGLLASGQVDRETREGLQTWKMIKSGNASFSIGFMATKSSDRPDGGRHIEEIDLLEVSAVSTPMHPATRATSWKSTGNGAFADAEWEMFRHAEAKAQAAHEQQRRDEELKKLISKVQAKAAKEAKRNRPIQIKRFEVG